MLRICRQRCRDEDPALNVNLRCCHRILAVLVVATLGGFAVLIVGTNMLRSTVTSVRDSITISSRTLLLTPDPPPRPDNPPLTPSPARSAPNAARSSALIVTV